MPECVVDRLEVVEINHDDRESAARTADEQRFQSGRLPAECRSASVQPGQLNSSFRRFLRKRARQDSNLQPSDSKSATIPPEPRYIARVCVVLRPPLPNPCRTTPVKPTPT